MQPVTPRTTVGKRTSSRDQRSAVSYQQQHRFLDDDLPLAER